MLSPQQRLSGAIGAAALIAWPVIATYEGTVNRGYRDPVGIVTACRGHTQFAQLGRTYTERECDELQAADMWKHDAEMRECIHVPINDGEHAAYLSFSFNVGAGAFCGSTLVKKLNAGDHAGACAELSRWTKAGGREWPGLVKRREAERDLCEGRAWSGP